jgi:hypothetical protein
MARNFEKRVSQRCLGINFHTYIPVNLYPFVILLKNTIIAVPYFHLNCSGASACAILSAIFLNSSSFFLSLSLSRLRLRCRRLCFLSSRLRLRLRRRRFSGLRLRVRLLFFFFLLCCRRSRESERERERERRAGGHWSGCLDGAMFSRNDIMSFTSAARAGAAGSTAFFSSSGNAKKRENFFTLCQWVLRIRIRDPRSEIRCLFDPWIRDG